jgi:hypothetical protein
MYYARIDTQTKICVEVFETDEAINYPQYIQLDSLDESLVKRKKYVNGGWVDTTADEACDYRAKYGECHHKWLEDCIGDTDNLSTTDKTSLVAAVNECFQNASDGKTAISNAIAGVDESITIPDNPTFAQLAACIAQISTGLQVAIGSMNVYTIPESITGETPFQPKIVIVYNFGSGLSNFNMGLYVSPEVTGVSSQQISDSANGIGNKLSRRANPFTITETGFSMVNTGAATDLKWIALG